MGEIICFDVLKEYKKNIKNFSCEGCRQNLSRPQDFQNSDDVLTQAVPQAMENRKDFGLKGLVKGLQAIIINTEELNFTSAIQEITNFTGYKVSSSYDGEAYRDAILKSEDSADIIVRNRKIGENPFLEYNVAPKTGDLPNTRLETFVFESDNINKSFEIQKERGVRFLSNDVIRRDNYSFIQTIPSSFTGNSVGLIQWHGGKGNYISNDDNEIDLEIERSTSDYLKNIKHLDHSATRLGSQNRDAAIIEFMELTNYHFDFAIYVKDFNSITNVARLSEGEYAQVFTTGIKPFTSLEESGPTEKFGYNYGRRVHHLAFHTENIEDTYEGLRQDGMGFLLELVGSPDEGLKQTFTKGMRSTFLVNEYIHRYGDFDGFFTKSNVTELTRATDAQ